MTVRRHGELALFTLAAALPAFAHHSGVYDETTIVEVSGVVVAAAWQNPHVVLHVSDAGAGAQNVWRLEGTSMNVLRRWGVGPERIPLGASISARGPVSRLDHHMMIAAVLRIEGGEPLVLWPNVADRLGLAATGTEDLFPPPGRGAGDTAVASANIFRVWTPRGSPQAAAPMKLLTARARELAAAYDPLADDPALRCIAPGMPRMLDTPYPIEFVNDDDRIFMRLEEWDAERTIYLRPGAGPPVQQPSPHGVSFGRWENTTLAVFTTYIDDPYADYLGTPQGRGVTVLERYTPNSDYSRLDWMVTITDATAFAEPWIKRGYFEWEPGESILPYNCRLSGVNAPPEAATTASPVAPPGR
jgi:hypothetical protein